MRPMAFLAALIALQLGGMAAAQPISGKISDGFYTNPDATFRIALPALADRDRLVLDGAPEEGVWNVEFSDERCRIFSVTERPEPVPPTDFMSWLEHVLVPAIRVAGGEQVELRRIEAAAGPSALIRYWKPASAPCRVYDKVHSQRGIPARMGTIGGPPLRHEDSLREADWTIWQPPARVALHVLAAQGRIYSFHYVIGDGVTERADWIGPPSLPLEARLEDFVGGFEILR